MSADIIERCLDMVVEKAGDPSELVYQCLYLKAPALKALFDHDPGGNVRAEMFQQVIEAVLDLVGPARYAENQIGSEWTNHQGLGVPPENFRLIFVAIIETFERVLGTAWTADFSRVWEEVLARVDRIINATAAAQQPGASHAG